MSTLAATLPNTYAPPAGWSRPAHPALVPPGAGTTLRVLDDTVTVKVDGSQTGGALAVFEVVVPAGSGAPPHRDPEDEVFYVLDGELTVTVDGAERRAAAGACVVIPRGTPHAYRNTGGRAARTLVLSAPAGNKTLMFAALERWARVGGPGGGPPDVNVVAAICRAHGVELLA